MDATLLGYMKRQAEALERAAVKDRDVLARIAEGIEGIGARMDSIEEELRDAADRQASALERIAKALEQMDTRMELCVEPENFNHPDLGGSVLKARRYE